MWRGEPFAGVGAHTGLAAERVCLCEEYLSALETRVAADLAAGYEGELVSELEALVREHPFRERLWGHLMVALHRTGRQADALAAYQRARGMLRDELGLEPGGELQRLERAVLAQDPSLDAPPRGRASASSPDRVFHSPIRYATCPDGVHIAYQVVGDGPIDVLCVPGFVCHLDMWWDAPTDDLVRRLASFSRLILFDKRGMGLSDRPEKIDAEDWVEDACAVLDAVGSERAVILGISAGGCTAALLAAGHPERIRALVIYGGYARILQGDGYELGYDRDTIESFISDTEANWGTSFGLEVYAPSPRPIPWPRRTSRGARRSRQALAPARRSCAHSRRSTPPRAADDHRTHTHLAPGPRPERSHRGCSVQPGSHPRCPLVEKCPHGHPPAVAFRRGRRNRSRDRELCRGTVPASIGDRSLATVLAVAPVAEPDHAPLIDTVITRCGGRALALPGRRNVRRTRPRNSLRYRTDLRNER